MRIAVSGTHCSGKTTLIEEFLRAHPDFAHEPEAYTVLVEGYGEEFSAEPGADDFYRQLEFSVERLGRYAAGEQVIFERSPVDYLAYLLALKDLNRDHAPVRTTCVSGWPNSVVQTAFSMVEEALRNLDLIVFLRLNQADGIEPPDDEDPKLRRAVNSRLAAIFEDDEFGFVGAAGPKIVTASGSTAQRLRAIETAIALTFKKGDHT